MKTEKDSLVFSTGKKMYANCAIVGLCPGSDETVVFTGYDDGIGLPEQPFNDLNALTPDECVELADAMIERWGRFMVKYKQLRDANRGAQVAALQAFAKTLPATGPRRIKMEFQVLDNGAVHVENFVDERLR